MNRGRRNLKQAASEQDFTLEECQSIAQVVSLRGSNQIEVLNTLPLYHLRFHNFMQSRLFIAFPWDFSSISLLCMYVYSLKVEFML